MEKKYMNEKQIRMEAIEKIIRRSKIQTFEKILNKMNCSSITLRRDIKAICGITSFTHRLQR
jgi:DeoR/GlpR family transcriptional regulator of sugar metabolism